jgi:hypothetical protein
MRASVAYLRHVKYMLEAAGGALLGEHVRGPAAGGVRRVGLAAIEVVGEHTSLGTMERVRTPSLLAVSIIPPGNSCAVHDRDQRAAWFVRDDDRREAGPWLHGGACTARREQPDAVPLDLEAGILDGHSEPVPCAVVADEDEPAARLEDAEKQPDECRARQHIPGTGPDSVWRVADDRVEGRRLECGEHVGGVAANETDGILASAGSSGGRGAAATHGPRPRRRRVGRLQGEVDRGRPHRQNRRHLLDPRRGDDELGDGDAGSGSEAGVERGGQGAAKRAGACG